MPYIGNTPADKFLTLAKQSFSTSATTSYTLDSAVSSTQDIALFINNVRQSPVDAYSVSGTSLTLTSATAGTDEMYCVYLGKTVGTVSPATNSITNAMMTDDSVGLVELSATGTPSSSNYLRGDNSWASAGVSGIDSSADATAITIDSSENVSMSQNLSFNSGFGSATTVFGCRVWANVDQVGTQAIQGSGGVSSITDTGTGATDVNFSTAMPDGNYSMMIAPGSNLLSTGSQQFPVAIGNDGVANTTKGIIASRQCDNDAATFTTADASQICVAFFR